MAEFGNNELQTVALNDPLLFNSTSIPCNKGYILHEDGTGNFILRGATNNCFARYLVNVQCNVGIPTGGTVTPIAIAVSVNGETRPTSRAITNPTAVDTFESLSTSAVVTVPRGCCFNVAVRSVSGITDGTTVPTPNIDVINANVTITRVA